MNRHTYLKAIVLGVVVLLGCSRDLDLPSPSDISKQDREALGDFVNQRILSQSDVYPMLARDSKTTTIYLYLQALYDQLTYPLREDFLSISNKRWTKDRIWDIRIFESSDQIAFAVPGGDCYLSTGMLASLTSEADLYYILSTEALIIQQGLLLESLIGEYSTSALLEMARKGISTDNRTENITSFIPLIQYSSADSDDLVQNSIDHICRTSRLSPLVYTNLEILLSANSQWLSTRPKHDNISTLQVCGQELSEDLFKSFVLDRL